MENASRPPVTGYPAPPSNGHPTPNTTYPYPAPPPQSQPYNYASYYNAPLPYPNRRATFIRTFIVAIVAVCVIFGCAVLIFWLVVRPRLPEFHLTSLSVSNFSTNQSQVTGNWDVGFEAYNPNKKMSISYYDVDSYIYYDSQLLTRTRIPPFKQDTRDRTELNPKFSVVGSYVDRKAADDMNADRARGTVGFDVRLDAIAGFKYGGWRTRRRVVRVLCDDVPVNISSSKGSGSLVGGARKCRVRIKFRLPRDILICLLKSTTYCSTPMMMIEHQVPLSLRNDIKLLECCCYERTYFPLLLHRVKVRYGEPEEILGFL